MTTMLVCGPRPLRGRYAAGQWNWTVTELGHAVARAIYEGGVDEIISGGVLGPDQIGIEAALRERDKKGANVRVIIARPCPSQAARWDKYEQMHYERLCQGADRVVTLGDDPCTADKYHARNRWMVDQSDYITAVWLGIEGGTKATVDYALSRGKRVLLLDVGRQESRWVR